MASVSNRPKPTGFAGHRDADRVDDVADLDALRGDECVHRIVRAARRVNGSTYASSSRNFDE